MRIEASYRRISAAEWDQLQQLQESSPTLDGFGRYEAYASMPRARSLWKICEHASIRSHSPKPGSTQIHDPAGGTSNNWNRCSGSTPSWSVSSVMPHVRATWF
jgi:hypothetical protein